MAPAFTIPSTTRASLKTSRILLLQSGAVLTHRDHHHYPDACFFDHGDLLAAHISVAEDTHLVGHWRGQSVALVEVEDEQLLPEHMVCRRLRELLPLLDGDGFVLLSRAMQLSHWERDHRYCGRCGGKMDGEQHEFAKICRQCNNRCYPRISPCVIGVVLREDRVLLARGPNHPPAMYTAIAGFIEAGESAEQAFAREVEEEVGLKVGNLRYCGSQSWPFPGQLMLAFCADHEAGDIKVDGVEIESADWFSLNALPPIPPEFTISGRLIRALCSQTNREDCAARS